MRNRPFCSKLIADNKKFWAAAIVLLVTIAFVRMVFNKGEPLQVDLPVWTSITHLLRTEVLPDQKWFWGIFFQREEAGLVLGESYSLQMILPWLLSFIFSPALTIKLACWLTGLALSLAFYFLAAKHSKPFFAFLGALYIFNISFYNITDGMWYNQLGIALALWFWLTLEHYRKHPTNRYWILSIFLSALSIYCHPIGFLGVILIWLSILGSFIFHNMKNWEWLGFFKLFSIPVVSVLLAAPQVLSLISSSQHSQAGLNPGRFFWKIQFGYLLNINLLNKWIQLPLLTLAFFGFIFLWKNKRDVFVTSFALYLMAVSIFLRIFTYIPVKIRLLYQITSFPYRFQFWSQVIYLLWLAVALNWLYSIVRSKTQDNPNRGSFFKHDLFVAFMIFLLLYGTVNLAKIVSLGRQTTFGVYSHRWEVKGLFDWLTNNIDASKTRVFFEDSNGTYKWTDEYPDPSPFNCSTHILALSDVYTPINHIGGWFGTSSNFYNSYGGDGGAIFGMRENGYSEMSLANDMKLLNCKYIVAHSRQAIQFLDHVSFLRFIRAIGRFKIYEYSALEPAWAFFESGRFGNVEIKKISPTRFSIHLANKEKDNLIISIAYNNRWKAYANEKEVPIFSTASLICIPINNPGSQEFSLEYKIEKRKSVFVLFLGLISIPVGLLFPPTRKKWLISACSINSRR